MIARVERVQRSYSTSANAAAGGSALNGVWSRTIMSSRLLHTAVALCRLPGVDRPMQH